MVPEGALFEAEMGVGSDGRAVALYDVSELLPRSRAKRYRQRPLEQVTQQYVHHSGALRKGDPYRHMLGSARFAVRSRGWPGFSYHTWIPHWDDFDPEGRRIIYLGNPIGTRTYHAGTGPNDRAIAHCLQGNLSAKDMSPGQAVLLPVVLEHFASQLGILPTPRGHFQAPADGHAKEPCPGRAGKAWILGYQAALGVVV